MACPGEGLGHCTPPSHSSLHIPGLPSLDSKHVLISGVVLIAVFSRWGGDTELGCQNNWKGPQRHHVGAGVLSPPEERSTEPHLLSRPIRCSLGRTTGVLDSHRKRRPDQGHFLEGLL